MDPKELQYTRTHEWCYVEKDIVTIGVTDMVAAKLGPIVYVELPDPGDDVLNDEPLGEIESFKMVVQTHSPVDGVVAEVNSRLADNPDPVTQDPFGKGWLAKIRFEDRAPLDELLNYDEYKQVPKKL